MGMRSWREKARQLKTDTYTLYLASKHPRVPWYVKLFTALIVLYALSPIDLIPDFIPVLGYLDDIIVIAAGFSLAIKMIPGEVLVECRAKAGIELNDGKRKRWIAPLVIVGVWLMVVSIVVRFVVDAVS